MMSGFTVRRSSIAQPQAVQHSGSHVLGHHVALGHQASNDLARFLLAQVERDRELAEIQIVEERRLVEITADGSGGERVDTGVVETRVALDLDHLRSQHPQKQSSLGSRPGPGEVRHPDPRQRPLAPVSVPHQITPAADRRARSCPE